MSSPRAFVIGHPIGHSRSPMLHGYWLKHYGIEGSYEALDIPPHELTAFFGRLKQEGWAGGNVTVPHKAVVLGLVDRLEPAARAVGAVNTVWWEGDTLVGDNTDASGFVDNLDETMPGWDARAHRAVILGAGGAARSLAYGLRTRGIDVALCNRNFDKAAELAAHFGGGVSAHGLAELPELMRAADLLVNATSLGMVGQPALSLDLAPLKRSAIVSDIVYAPLETGLLRDARARGHSVVDGLGMLLHQAVGGFSRWFGRRPQVSRDLRDLLAADIRAKTAAAPAQSGD